MSRVVLLRFLAGFGVGSGGRRIRCGESDSRGQDKSGSLWHRFAVGFPLLLNGLKQASLSLCSLSLELSPLIAMVICRLRTS